MKGTLKNRLLPPPHLRFDTRVPQQGVGLGLYIVRSIVEAHGGDIRLSSHPGNGTTFEILLPLWESEV